MKRKLLPYGMPLGGGMSGLGTNSFPGPTGSSSGGGKSSGAGQGGYGGAPSFGGQPPSQPTAQTQPSFTQSPFPQTPFSSSVNTTTYPQQGMMGDDFGRGNRGGMPMQGGKSLGGVGPYGGAPGFGGMGTFSPVSQEQFNNSPLRNQWGSYEKYAQNGSGISGPGAPPPPGFGGMGAAADKRAMLGGFGPQAPDTSEQAYRQRMAMSSFRPGTAPSYEQWKQQTENPFSGIKGMGGFGQQIGTLAQPANNFGQFGAQTNPLPPPGFENMANNPEFNSRLQGSSGGAQMQAPTREGYDSFMARAKFAPGTQPTYEQWAQSQNDRAAEQRAGAEAFNNYREQQFSQQRPGQQPSQMGGQLGFMNNMLQGQPAIQGRSGAMSPEMQDYYAMDRAAQAERVQRMQGMFGGQQQFQQPQQRFQQPQFNPFQQQPVSPFQQQFGRVQQPRQQFGGFQQQPQQQSQDMRGLAELLNLLRGRQG
jgi:hypothetical protein